MGINLNMRLLAVGVGVRSIAVLPLGVGRLDDSNWRQVVEWWTRGFLCLELRVPGLKNEWTIQGAVCSCPNQGMLDWTSPSHGTNGIHQSRETQLSIRLIQAL